ncbi:MAG: ferredoxin [Planctomycetota bacterium]|jgi:ferredoxin
MPRHDQSTANVNDAPGEARMAPENADQTAAPKTPAPEGIEDVLAARALMLEQSEDAAERPDLPVLPALPANGQTGEATELRQRLRQFHAGHRGAADDLEPPGDDYLPALLRPFRDPERVRHDYPLFLIPDSVARDRLSAPVSELLKQLTEGFAPDPGDARIVKDNFPRLERRLRETLDGAGPPVDAAERLSQATRAMEQSLDLRGESAQRLHDELHKLVESIPPDGKLLPLSEQAPLHLFIHAARHHMTNRRSALQTQVGDLRNRLRDLLRADSAKRAGKGFAPTIGTAGQAHLDAEALARMIGRLRGSAPMKPARRNRIKGVIETLDGHLSQSRPLVMVVHHDDVPDACRPADAEWRQVDGDSVCHTAVALFDEVAGAHASLFAAMRIGRLELAEAYDPPRHDGLRDTFDWRAFSREELLNLPPVLALVSAQHLAGSGILDLSRLLLSGRPINIIVAVQAATNPALSPQDDPLAGYRFELAYLGVSYREAVVNQSSAARPEHLLHGFERGLEAARASLHVVASGLLADGRPPPLGAWLQGGAALEGRAHPLFQYDPEAGETWARRLDFSTNPQPEADWPLYKLPCRSAAGQAETLTVAFTFADFALTEDCYRHHFRVIPPEVGGDEFMTVDEYLTLPPEEALDRVPFIWAADARNRLHRLVITRRLTFACRDRLAYWHTLQELAGVRNQYVREAVERERQRLESDFAAKRKQQEQDHAAEVEKVRTEAAAETMARLAEWLVKGDLSTLGAAPLEAVAPGAPDLTAAPTEAPAAPENVEAAAAEVEEEEVEVDEPWIDTVLCTSCNDCLGINPRLFVYNANKQAVIGDARAGTFAELVKGAEICPARCIHPGKPLNPEEPNLEELIERAKPFN